MTAPTLETPSVVLPDDRDNLLLRDRDPDSPDPAQRPMGINIGGHTVTQATAHLPEDQKALIRWLHDHARTNHLGWPELAAAVELDTSTLSRIWKDTYRYPKENVERDRAGAIIKRTPHPRANERIPLDRTCEKIARFKRKAIQTGRVQNPDFVKTEIAERIYWLCGRVAANHKLGFIWGESQIGKTTALKEYAATHNGGATTYLEMPPASGVQLMLKCLARAMHVPAKSAFDALLEDIISALDESKLLLIDETQRVFTTYQKTSVMRCLDTLRYIHDQSKCGMVICGTNVLRQRVEGGEFAQYLKQLNRRGRSYQLQLPTAPPRADLDLVAAHFGLDPAPKASQAEQIMQHIAAQDGLGVYRLRLEDARDYARNKKEDLKWDHFIKAFAITEKAAGKK